MLGKGTAKNGASLLSGLITCAHCGYRMLTNYTNNGNKLRYSCVRESLDYGGSICLSLFGNQIDELVEKQILEALKPSSLEISLRVAEDIEQERENLINHWEKKLERAHYEIERAYRQYNAIEPENRLVARTLEKKWEEALCADEKLKREYAKFLENKEKILTIEERESIRQLSVDVPTLWSSSSTTTKERKEIARLLIDRVIVSVEGNTEKGFMEIHWSGGHKTQTSFIRSVGKFEQLSYYPELLSRIKKLREDENKTLSEVADILNFEGWRSARRQVNFNSGIVGTLLTRAGVNRRRNSRSKKIDRMKNEWTLRELSKKTNIPEPTLYLWIKKGHVKSRKITSGYNGMLLINADEEEINRLCTLRNQPRQWIYSSRVKKVN